MDRGDSIAAGCEPTSRSRAPSFLAGERSYGARGWLVLDVLDSSEPLDRTEEHGSHRRDRNGMQSLDTTPFGVSQAGWLLVGKPIRVSGSFVAQGGIPMRPVSQSLVKSAPWEVVFAAGRALVCALVVSGCWSGAADDAVEQRTPARPTVDAGASLQFSVSDVSFASRCDSSSESVQTQRVDAPKSSVIGFHAITYRIEGSSAFSFEGGARELVFAKDDAQPIWVNVVFDPAVATGDLQGTLTADDGTLTTSIPLHARSAKLTVEVVELDSLPLVLGEAFDLYRITLTNLGDGVEQVHVGEDAQYVLSTNDFVLAPNASEVVTVSATISDPHESLAAFHPAISLAGCSAPIKPNTQTAAPSWTHGDRYAVASHLLLAQDYGGGPSEVEDGINIGVVLCGKSGAVRTLRLANLSHDAMDVTFAMAKGSASPFTLDQGMAHLAARSSTTFTLAPRPIPQYPSSFDADAFSDRLNVTATGENSPMSVTVSEIAGGHRLSFVNPTIDFGDVPVGGSASRTAIVRDDGAPAFDSSGFGGLANIAAIDPSTWTAPFGSSLTSALVIQPQRDTPFPVTFRPTAKGRAAGEISPSVVFSEAICSPLPTLKLVGNGI